MEKNKANNKTKVITVRLDPSEYKELMNKVDKSKYNSYGPFIRDLIKSKQIKSKSDQQMLKQVMKIGNNINQIARIANTYKQNVNESVFNDLKEISDQLKKLTK